MNSPQSTKSTNPKPQPPRILTPSVPEPKPPGRGGFFKFFILLLLLAMGALGYVMLEYDESPQQTWNRIVAIYESGTKRNPVQATNLRPQAEAALASTKASPELKSLAIGAQRIESKAAAQASPDSQPLPRGDHPIDILRFGSSASEVDHAFSTDRGEIVKGALGQDARRLLPLEPLQGNGGNMIFTMKIDPEKRNYFTVKLWADDDTSEVIGRLYLYIPKDGRDYQVGYRHEGDYMPLSISTPHSALPGRFFYSTTLLPLSMTQGKTEITLKIQSVGRLYGYGRGAESEGGNYQFNMKMPSRGIYSAYTHTEAMLAVPADEVQGEAPKVTRLSTSGEGTLGPEGEFTRNVNGAIQGLIKRDKLRFLDIEALAKAYFVPQVKVAYRNPKVLDKLVEAIDSVAIDYYKDPENGPKNWGGAYGPVGWAVNLVAGQLTGRLGETADYGKGGRKLRRQAWGDMLHASIQWGRFNDLRTLTNQTIYASASLYSANRGLIALRDPRALLEKQAQRYLAGAVGIEPWLGNDLPNGGHDLHFGSNYFQTTRKAQTREWGFAGSGYGEMQYMVSQFFRMTGNPAFREQAVRIARSRAPFRRPTEELDERSGNYYRGMQGIGEIGWRGGGTFFDHNMYEFRKPLSAAAATMDPVLIGYAKQMLEDDNQFFAQLGRGGADDVDIWADYEAIKNAPDSHARLPMTDGQPDFVWADDENQVLALKQGDCRFWLITYWQAKLGINSVGRFLYSTPRYVQYGAIETHPEFTPSGGFATRPEEIDSPGRTLYRPPNPPLQAYAGEKLPLAKWPADAKENSPFIGHPDFSSCRFGPWLIGFNSTPSKTFTLPTPDFFKQAKDLVSGKVQSGPVTVGPLSTVVLEDPSTSPASVSGQ